MNVIDAVLWVVAKSLYAREVFEAPSLGVQEGFVHAKIMRIAMHVSHWLAEGDHFFSQGEQVVLEAIGGTIGLGQSLGIA